MYRQIRALQSGISVMGWVESCKFKVSASIAVLTSVSGLSLI